MDEDVPKRLASELRERGRACASIYAEGLKGTLDPDLIRLLAERYGDDVVLVTANESMPIEHADVLAQTGLTLAVVDGLHEGDEQQDEWKRETVHRWAHAIAAQRVGTIERYSPYTHRRWTRRRRRA